MTHTEFGDNTSRFLTPTLTLAIYNTQLLTHVRVYYSKSKYIAYCRVHISQSIFEYY